jgi:sulfate adenylyltransferase subunit 2
VILALGDYNHLVDGEKAEEIEVRFRTIGDMTCTGAVESPAREIDDIIQEIAATRTTERGGRADDKRSEAAMEDRKKMGYF